MLFPVAIKIFEMSDKILLIVTPDLIPFQVFLMLFILAFEILVVIIRFAFLEGVNKIFL